MARAYKRSSRLPLARLPRACRGRGCSSEEGEAAISGPDSSSVAETDNAFDPLGVAGWRLSRPIELHGRSAVARYSFTGVAMDKTGHAVLRDNSFSHGVFLPKKLRDLVRRIEEIVSSQTV